MRVTLATLAFTAYLGLASAVQESSDGQIEVKTSATPLTPSYTAPGVVAPTGKSPFSSGSGLYYVPAATGKVSNTTHSSGYKFSYGPNTAPPGAIVPNSTALLYSSGAVTVSGTAGAPGQVTQTAVANAGVGSGAAGTGVAGGSSVTHSPITQATGAAIKNIAGGLLAGVGAVAALVL